MLRINIAGLAPGSHRLEMHPEASALDLEPDVFRDITVSFWLDVHPRRILVRLQATATATLECDRTLVAFDQPIEGTYAVLFAPPEMVTEMEEEHEDVRPFTPADQELDLTDAVRDTLMLAIPVRKVAPGAEDVDLPLRFGDTGEIDPRWEALRRLQSGT